MCVYIHILNHNTAFCVYPRLNHWSIIHLEGYHDTSLVRRACRGTAQKNDGGFVGSTASRLLNIRSNMAADEHKKEEEEDDNNIIR